jgi:hypothetical protein
MKILTANKILTDYSRLIAHYKGGDWDEQTEYSVQNSKIQQN